MGKEDFGPTGIDPDWYDNGPGSENCKLEMRRQQMKYDAKVDERKRREREVLEIAEAMEAWASRKDSLVHRAEIVQLGLLPMLEHFLERLYKAVQKCKEKI